MPRFYFDVHDTGSSFDEEGTELPSLDAVPAAALRILPPIASDELREGRDNRNFCVLVSDEDGKAVYSATLSYVGLWLLR